MSAAIAMRLRFSLGAGCRIAAAAIVVASLGTQTAQAYIGPSFVKLADVPGTAREQGFDKWIRAESNYWTEKPVLPEIRGAASQKNDLLFTGPVAPTGGPNMLAISIDKHNPALNGMMKLCRSGTRVPQITFAESSELARHPQEHGPRPADVPDYYEYRLRDVQLTCPVVDGAPEQAFALQFREIEWLNYRPQAEPRHIISQTASLSPVSESGASKVFAMTWFAASVDSRADQCPQMNTKAGPEDYFRLLPADQAAKERALLAGKGVGPDRMSYRGPDHMNVTLMPGIVADPGHASPISEVAHGFDLDGDDGSGAPPPGVRKHRNFVSPDGRTGIDNQLFTVEGCVEGFRRKGFLPMIFNESRVGGRPTALVKISGIDDERNDDDVTVTILFSTDLIQRSPSKVILADYTYRITDDPEFAQDFARFKGRIVDGVITTEPSAQLHMHEILGIETTIIEPRMRLEMLPDGTLKGVVGGYIDWRQRVLWQTYRAADYENTIGFQAPAIYNAMKRAADGLQDPVTGEFTGISAAFEIEGVAAFLSPVRRDERIARAPKGNTEKE
ncbi:MAG: hypothetical protein H6917_15830 [Novosphingobium sp.]|nr:hypothetical protein [Novosphingobium sp.]MCP5403842.1 hypothetical protein [Novosphingobium sp.]